MPFGILVIVLVALFGVGGMIVIALRRMGWLGHTDHPVSSGLANGLAEINAMLQPQQPSAEALAQLRDEGEDEQDEGEGDDVHRGLRPSGRSGHGGRSTNSKSG